MQKTLGWIMLLAGVFILFVGYAFPMVTVVVDTEPPTFTASNPSSGSIVLQIDSFTAKFTDSGLGVEGVYFSLASLVTNQYLVTQQPMTLISGDMYSGTWEYIVSPVVTDSGKYVVYVQAGDYADNWVTQMVELQVYVQFQGKWYVNDKEIVSSNQTIYSKTNSVKFKFVKTAGIADKYITCTVWEGSTQLLTLTNSAMSTWTGSYTFTLGKHTLDLKASDETQTVTMSVIDLQVGPESFQLPQVNMLQILSLASIAIGTLLVFTGKKH